MFIYFYRRSRIFRVNIRYPQFPRMLAHRASQIFPISVVEALKNPCSFPVGGVEALPKMGQLRENRLLINY